MRQGRALRGLGVACAVGLILFFLLFPRADLAVSALVYDPFNKYPETGFIYSYHPFLRWLQRAVHYVDFATLVVILTAFLLRAIPRFRRRMPRRRTTGYLLLALLIGPYLLVHEGLKDNVGRPRPRQTVEFGGEMPYQPPLAISHYGGTSFVSGHAALAFYYTAFAYVQRTRRRRIAAYAGGILFGLFVGAARVLQGAHFVSDIVFAGLIVLAVNHALAWAILSRRSNTIAKAGVLA